jgi:hypothetical protein
MPTKTSIYNDVLNIVGSTVFISNADTDTSPKTLAMNAAFDLCRREVLRAHDWAFAETRVDLVLVGVNETEYGYQYAYPNKCIRARELQKDIRRSKPIPFKVARYSDEDNGEMRVVLTDQENARLIYTYDVEDLAMFDDLAGQALAGLIAFRCSKAITTDKNAGTVAWNYFRSAISEARAADGNERVEDDPVDCDWIVARSGVSDNNQRF